MYITCKCIQVFTQMYTLSLHIFSYICTFIHVHIYMCKGKFCTDRYHIPSDEQAHCLQWCTLQWSIALLAYQPEAPLESVYRQTCLLTY